MCAVVLKSFLTFMEYFLPLRGLNQPMLKLRRTGPPVGCVVSTSELNPSVERKVFSFTTTRSVGEI